MNLTALSKYAPMGLSVLRIVAAILFFLHGSQKLFGFPASMMPSDGEAGLPPMMLTAGILEVAGGIALLLGLFTRPVAFILAGEMAVAYWIMHVPRGGLFPVSNGGDGAVLFCFVFLYLVLAGPGPLSIDATRNSRPAAT